MATEGSQFTDGTRTANADLSAKQFYAVKLIAGRKVDLPAASTDEIFGILQNKPASGGVADVAYVGECKAIAGAAITEGAKVMANSAGKLITFVGAAGNCMVGWAAEAAAGDLSIFEVKLGVQVLLT
jgi:hypothetical protein